MNEPVINITEENGKIVAVNINIPILSKEKDGYFFAQCPFLKAIGVSNKSHDEAKKELQDDIEIFIALHKQRGTLRKALENLGWATEDHNYQFQSVPSHLSKRASERLVASVG